MSHDTFRIDVHVVFVACIMSAGSAMLLNTIASTVVAVGVCQFPILTRANSPRFRGWKYLLANEAITVAIALLVCRML